MKISNVFSLLYLSITFFASFNTEAIIINNHTFSKNGGDLENIAGTLELAYQPIKRQSYLPQFDAVGKIYACTSTWLGDSSDGKTSYILTAAHCVEHKNTQVASDDFYGEFRDRYNRLIAQDGRYFLGPYRITPPSGFGGASTDIAILALHKKADMTDENGVNLTPPVLYDGTSEKGKPVSMVGYGDWGAGDIAVHDDTAEAIALRACGESFIDDIWEMGYGMSAPYQHDAHSDAWARLSKGDSGSAWWQQHSGFWTIVGVTNGGNTSLSTSSRVSQYIRWIKSIYPQTRTLTDVTTVTAKNGLVLPDLSTGATNSSVTYTVPLQTYVKGPSSPVWDAGAGFSRIVLLLSDTDTTGFYPVILRAWRDVGCGEAPMNTAVSCGNKQSALNLQFRQEDNLALPHGHYRGSFKILATGWHDKTYRNVLQLSADIDTRKASKDNPLYPRYIPGHRYNAGDRVTAQNGRDYQCKRFPFTHLCAGNSTFYGPGSGTHWFSAWIRIR